MKGQRIGYIRVSSFDQNPDRQLDGIATDRNFIDRASGKSIERPQLEEMLQFVREGDTIIVHSMDRLARNLDDLRTLVRNLTSKGIDIQFCKEQLTFTNNDSPMSQLLLSVMGAFAEFERALLKERQKEGIEIAKRQGKYRGRKRALDEAQIAELKVRANAGEVRSNLAKEYGISRETLYSYLRK
ncbi:MULTISPECIES: recombinase family protein [Vibrio]|uniref:recombinase family protein n=1 Tax=Vibrio TaxID=662 RepID=UPI000C82FBE2|nr:MULTISPECIES: recombinase family protein [Vibrio]PMM39114.1 transposase [Vibrio lentus]TCN86391.1 DNA invertase Pin-like site-specific DNA recombinase [Vibrio crassostreae]